MKAVTIAKIARLIVIIAVAIVLAVPTFAGIESMKINDGGFIETDSVYEVTHMTTGDLKSNITEVADGKSGYTIRYGSTIESVPTADSEIDDLVNRVKTAAGDAKTFEAVMMDPDGKVCKQQMIMGSNGLTQYITTGLKLTESLVNMVKIDVSLDSVLYGTRNVISDVVVDRIGDSYRITIPIPYILFATALAGGKDSQLGLSIDIGYNNFFNATFRLDLPMEKFMNSDEGGGGGGIPDIDCKVKSEPHAYAGNNPTEFASVQVQQEIEVDLPEGLTGLSDITASIGDFGGESGGVRIEVNESGKVQLMTDNPEGLVKELMSKVDPDTGELVLKIDSSDPEIPSTFTIEKEYVDSFLSMSDEIIKALETLEMMSS